MKTMGEIKKLCGFCVSDWHFITMITPYINKKIKEKEKILIYSSQSYSLLIRTFLPKLIIGNEKKEQIANLNWSESRIKRGTQIEEDIENVKEKNITIIVKGDNSYIDKVNTSIKKCIKDYDKKITIVNCFDIGKGDTDIEKILKQHDKILNTSGEKEISEFFEGVS